MPAKQVKITAAQNAALDALLKATGDNFSALVTRLIEGEAARHGIVFPQDKPPRSNIHDNYNKKRRNSDERNVQELRQRA